MRVITTFAGTDWVFDGDGKPALTAPLSSVDQMAIDPGGNLIFADPDNQVVSRIDPSGALTVIAGNGLRGFSGDGGPARNASLALPRGVAFDGQGNLYIADQANNRIRVVDRAGMVRTFAGNGIRGAQGDGGPAVSAQLNLPDGVAISPAGDVYITDSGNFKVRRVAPNGTISTFAGTGRPASNGDGGTATDAATAPSRGIVIAADGSVYFSEPFAGRVRRVLPGGTIVTYAGTGGFPDSGDGGPAESANLTNPVGLAFDANGNLLVGSFVATVRSISPGGIIETLAGGPALDYSGDGGPASGARFRGPRGIAAGSDGRVYIADSGNFRIRLIDAAGIVRTIAGSGGYRNAPDGTPALSAYFLTPQGLAIDASSRLLVSDYNTARIRRIGNNRMSTIAGSGIRGCCFPDRPATEDLLGGPASLAVGPDGSVYFSDVPNYLVRRISPDGFISTYAGRVQQRGFSGDGGPATSARLSEIYGLALDGDGNLYLSDFSNHVIRRVSAGGTITTVAGKGQQAGFAGDAGPASSALFRQPQGLALDASGNLYVADSGNQRIRVISPSGVVTTIAGNGTRGSSGDSGPAIEASLDNPSAIAIDPGGSIYVCELDGHRIRRISPDGIISTVAGTGIAGFSGDGGAAGDATLNFPSDLALDAAGNLFIADAENNRIRVVLAEPPSSTPQPASLSFSGRSGGAPPAAQQLLAGASVSGAPFSVTVEPGADWLSVTPREGAAPRLIEVGADPASLAPGQYQGVIRLRYAAALPAERTIQVTFQVGPPPPPQLAVEQTSLSFPFARSSAPRALPINLANTGGGVVTARVSARMSEYAWLTVNPPSVTVSPSNPATIEVSANPRGLVRGVYNGSVVFEGNGQKLTIPVTMLLSGRDSVVLLSQSGLSFTAVEGGGIVPPQRFSVLKEGGALASFRASPARVEGPASWLSVGSCGAASPACLAPAPVEVRVNAAGLPPGSYSALVRIDAPGAANSPVAATVYLQVLPANQDPGAEVDAGELLFASTAAAPSPSSQDLRLYGVGAAAKSYRAVTSTEVSGDWLLVAPRDGTIAPDRPTRVVVQPLTGSLAPGVYRGRIAFQFSDGTVRIVRVSFIVAGIVSRGPAAPSSSRRAAEGDCVAENLVPALTSLGQSFQVSAGWPVALAAEVRDNCGAPIVLGRVVASFSNGDPSIPLTSVSGGGWQGTWSANSRLSQVRISLTAESAQGLRGRVEVTGDLRSAQDPPRFEAAAVVSSVNLQPNLPLAPGALVTITGDRLAEGAARTASAPLPASLGGTLVLIAGREMPLAAVSEHRIDAVMPYGIESNTSLQLVVARGGALSRPVTVAVAAAQAAIAPQGSVSVVRTLFGGSIQFALEPGSAARSGDKLVVVCAGLGEVNPPLEAGVPAPDARQTPTREPVRLTVGGVEASVTFSGLVPGQVGVYRVEAPLPPGVPSGFQVPVVVTAAGLPSPPVFVPVE